MTQEVEYRQEVLDYWKEQSHGKNLDEKFAQIMSGPELSLNDLFDHIDKKDELGLQLYHGLEIAYDIRHRKD
jgi:hypothetical protein